MLAERASCGAVEEERVIKYCGVLVPKPVKLLLKMLLEIDDVESRLPTVSCEDVAIRLPLELVVMMELGEKVVAEKT